MINTYRPLAVLLSTALISALCMVLLLSGCASPSRPGAASSNVARVAQGAGSGTGVLGVHVALRDVNGQLMRVTSVTGWYRNASGQQEPFTVSMDTNGWGFIAINSTEVADGDDTMSINMGAPALKFTRINLTGTLYIDFTEEQGLANSYRSGGALHIDMFEFAADTNQDNSFSANISWVNGSEEAATYYMSLYPSDDWSARFARELQTIAAENQEQ